MAIVRALTAALIGVPITLPPELFGPFPELAHARYRRGGLPPRIGGWALGVRSVAAITLWRTVFLAPGTGLGAELLLHELAHVRQFEDVRAFAVRYVWESLRVGYQGNRYEAAARRFAALRLRTVAASIPAQEA